MSEIINNNNGKTRKALAELTEMMLDGQKDRDKVKEFREQFKDLNPSHLPITKESLIKKVINVIGPT